MKKVLFVCTGNTCRSSMAEAIAKKTLEDKGKKGEIEFVSAGIYAMAGDSASQQAIDAVKEYDIDLGSHRSRQVTGKLINEACIILTMTEAHKRSLVSLDPGVIEKIFTLKEYVDGKSRDIPDPFGQSAEVYRKCAFELKEYISKAIDRILDDF